MDRRLLFPAIAVTAWAQQTSPATAEAEKALRARAEQFYQLEVDKKFRPAEDFVAEDTKDYFYNNGKPDIRAFKVGNIEFTGDGTKAIVHFAATVVMTSPIGSQEFVAPASSTWKLENGQWVWYVIPSAEIDTPFGKWHPGAVGATGSALPAGMANPASVDSLVSIDRTTVDLSSGGSTVTITNRLPGAITLELGNRPEGLVVEIDKSRLAAGEKAVVSFSAAGSGKVSGSVRITALPINKEFVIQIKTK